MKPEEVLKQFKEWNESGWSKSETPSSEALILAIQALEKQALTADKNQNIQPSPQQTPGSLTSPENEDFSNE